MVQFNVAPAGVTANVLTLGDLFPGLSNQSAQNRIIVWTKSLVQVLPTLGNGRISMQSQIAEEYMPGSQFGGFGTIPYKLLSHVNSTFMLLNLSTMAKTAPNILRPYLISTPGPEALQFTSRLWDDEAEARSLLCRITSTCKVFPQGNLVSKIASTTFIPTPLSQIMPKDQGLIDDPTHDMPSVTEDGGISNARGVTPGGEPLD